MNNRLQVGGLALVIGSETGVDDNMGMVVTLTEYIGEYDHPLARNNDYWRVSGDGIVAITAGGKIVLVQETVTSAKFLMPLGDKKTQDELAKEKEIENA
jgi:hypothetical protein